MSNIKHLLKSMTFLLVYALLWLQIFGSMLNKRFYKMECPNNNESEYTKNFVCQIHRHQNGSTSITAYADLIRPLNFIKFNYIFFHKTSNKAIFNVTFEYCSSFGNAHPFVQYVLDSIKKLSNGLIHPCPYVPTVRIGIDQWTFNNNSMQLIQQKKG
ncbi:hypothetical protein ACKWTF_012579 [Chironomus riparius]